MVELVTQDRTEAEADSNHQESRRYGEWHAARGTPDPFEEQHANANKSQKVAPKILPRPYPEKCICQQKQGDLYQVTMTTRFVRSDRLNPVPEPGEEKENHRGETTDEE